MSSFNIFFGELCIWALIFYNFFKCKMYTWKIVTPKKYNSTIEQNQKYTRAYHSNIAIPNEDGPFQMKKWKMKSSMEMESSKPTIHPSLWYVLKPVSNES